MTTLAALSTVPKTQKQRSAGRNVLLWGLYIFSLALVVWLCVAGFSYYTTPYSERAHHPDYRALRPAGERGLMYGIIGSSMMMLMLVYTLRKRTRFFGRRIPLRPFLDFHIYMGVMGPLFILLHTSFKIQGIVAIAFWSMVAVAVSGYFGRYLYQQIPRNIEDRELTLQEIEAVTRRLEEDMQQRGHLDDAALAKLTSAFDDAYRVTGRGVVSSLFSVVKSDLKRPLVLARLRRSMLRSGTVPRETLEGLLSMASHRALMHRRLVVLGRVQQLFHYWHVIHKPFAIIMYIVMGVHIGVAVWTGYAW
jgi:hypothetical protein